MHAPAADGATSAASTPACESARLADRQGLATSPEAERGVVEQLGSGDGVSDGVGDSVGDEVDDR